MDTSNASHRRPSKPKGVAEGCYWSHNQRGRFRRANSFRPTPMPTCCFSPRAVASFQLKAYDVPTAITRQAKGQAIVNFLQLAPEEEFLLSCHLMHSKGHSTSQWSQRTDSLKSRNQGNSKKFDDPDSSRSNFDQEMRWSGSSPQAEKIKSSSSHGQGKRFDSKRRMFGRWVAPPPASEVFV